MSMLGRLSECYQPLPSSVIYPSGASTGVLRPRDTFSVSGFGGRTNSSGHGVMYSGNVGIPYGSNIIEVSEDTADQYKYVAQFIGPTRNEEWTVVLWNKIGPSGVLGGWYGNACGRFTVAAGQTHCVAFDEDSQGGWAAARASSILSKGLCAVIFWNVLNFCLYAEYIKQTICAGLVSAHVLSSDGDESHSGTCIWGNTMGLTSEGKQSMPKNSTQAQPCFITRWASALTNGRLVISP